MIHHIEELFMSVVLRYFFRFPDIDDRRRVALQPPICPADVEVNPSQVSVRLVVLGNAHRLFIVFQGELLLPLAIVHRPDAVDGSGFAVITMYLMIDGTGQKELLQRRIVVLRVHIQRSDTMKRHRLPHAIAMITPYNYAAL